MMTNFKMTESKQFNTNYVNIVDFIIHSPVYGLVSRMDMDIRVVERARVKQGRRKVLKFEGAEMGFYSDISWNQDAILK